MEHGIVKIDVISFFCIARVQRMLAAGKQSAIVIKTEDKCWNTWQRRHRFLRGQP